MPPLVGSDEDVGKRRQVLVAFGKCLEEFRRLNPAMPIGQVQAFLLTIIAHELSVSEIADRTGGKLSTTSRYLLDLGVPRTEDDTAYGLLERSVDPMDPRRARFHLTRKGKALVNRLVDTLETACSDDDE